VIDAPPVPLSPQHNLIRRAFRTTVYSLWLPPLAFYSCYLIDRSFEEGHPPRRVYAMLAVTALVITIQLGFAAAMFLS